MQINNFSTIIERDGKRYLFDEKTFNVKVGAINSVDAIFGEVRDWLERNEYPATLEYIAGVVFDAGFLHAKTIAETENTAKRLKLPRHMAKIHVQAAERVLEELDTSELDDARQRFNEVCNRYGLNISQHTVYFDNGHLYVERDVVEEQLQRDCMRPIPDDVQKFCDYVRDIMPTLREYDDKGVPVRDTLNKLLGNFLAPHLRPDLNDESQILSFVYTHIHQTRAYMRIAQRDSFFLMGGVETEAEKPKSEE